MDDCETTKLYTEGMSNVQRCQPEDSLVKNGTPSTSRLLERRLSGYVIQPYQRSYWDTDDDDDECGPKPSELYGKFTWKIENFSEINKRKLRSNTFEVGGYRWYILIYPQGCDDCNHLSLFLCVANHDKLLPGWSHFAQFTIAVLNQDPKKSKYSDTLHRFWKKEHDWGWKKFMELSKVEGGYINDNSLLIKAQLQVISLSSMPSTNEENDLRKVRLQLLATGPLAVCYGLALVCMLHGASWLRNNLIAFLVGWVKLHAQNFRFTILPTC